MPGTAPVSVRLLLPAAATAGACSAFEVRAGRGTAVPPHVCAAQDGAVVVLDGVVAVACDDATRTVRAGDAVALPHGAACRIDVLEDALLLCIAVPAAFDDLVGLLDGAADPDDLSALLSAAGVSLLPSGWRRPGDRA